MYVYWEPHVSRLLRPVWCLLGEPLHLVLITEMWWGRVAVHHLKRLWLETWKSSSQRGEDRPKKKQSMALVRHVHMRGIAHRADSQT